MGVEQSAVLTVARRVMVHNGAAPGANTDIFTAITPAKNASCWRVGICLSTSSKVDIRVTDGSNAHSQVLNADVALVATAYYTFTFPVAAVSTLTGSTAMTYSLRVQTDSVIETLIVDEVQGAVI
jgi:hypothetical protein